MTKTKKQKRVRKAQLIGRPAIFPEDAFLISLGATVCKQTQAAFVRDLFRETLRKVLKDNGVDPDRAWANGGSV